MTTSKPLRAVRILLTITALEFFGPALRDAGSSHATNPAWVGHARLHIVWFIALLVTAGAVNLYLLWGEKMGLREATISAAWQASTIIGFWTAVVLAPAYGGIIAVNGIHTAFFGVDENVLFFSIMSALWLWAVALLARAHTRVDDAPAHEVSSTSIETAR